VSTNGQNFFKHKHIPHILSYQICEVSSSKPGVLLLRKSSSSAIEEISILRNSANSIAIGQIPLKGLSLDRQWYLYEHIREYCTTEKSADSTCPKPSLSKSVHQNSSAVLPATSELQSEPQSNATTAGKCQQLCSVSHCPGHKRSCPQK